MKSLPHHAAYAVITIAIPPKKRIASIARRLLISFWRRRAHVPLGAGSRVTHGVGVVVTGNHLNETAPSGYVARLVAFVFICCRGNSSYTDDIVLFVWLRGIGLNAVALGYPVVRNMRCTTL